MIMPISVFHHTHSLSLFHPPTLSLWRERPKYDYYASSSLVPIMIADGAAFHISSSRMGEATFVFV